MARMSETSAPAVYGLPDAARLRRIAWAAARVTSPALLVIAWEALARSGSLTDYMLPPLSTVLLRVLADLTSGDFFANVGLTLYRTFAGFGIAAVTGIAVGLAMAHSRLAHWFFDPMLSVGFPMPKIAFLPVFILWFGFYDLSKITIIVVSAIFPVAMATVLGLQGVERELVWSAQSLGADERRCAWEIVLPAALPQVLTGLQVALPTSLIVALVSEFIMGGYGLGASMMESSRLLDSTEVFAGIVEIAFVGQCVLVAMTWARRRLLVWHQETEEPTGV
jgi:ABC-type nitrate/sulfonate/bicarbonate transport system permease component